MIINFSIYSQKHNQILLLLKKKKVMKISNNQNKLKQMKRTKKGRI